MNKDIEKFIRENEALIISAGLNIDSVRSLLHFKIALQDLIAEVIRKWKDTIFSFFERLMQLSDEVETEYVQYKLDFTRPIIRHQVLDRKPKHLIKKIIH